MRKLSDSEIVILVYTLLCVVLGTLVFHYRSRQQFGPTELQQFVERNIEFRTDFYGLRYHGVSNNLIDAHILYYGAYEKPVLYWLRDTARALGEDDIVFLDIGANTGQHSLFMSKIVRFVHSFEPYPPVLVRLRAAIEENALDNVAVHPVGLGAANEILEFFEPPASNPGTGSFVRPLNDRTAAVSQLQIVVGDEYLAAQDVERVDLVKIDVEGYEKNVLAGLKETLGRDRPIVILEVTRELGAEVLFQSQGEIRSAFPPDYEFSTLSYPGLEDLSTGSYETLPFTVTSPSFIFNGQSMVIAYPVEKSDAVPPGANR
jgi:FkbM family methyltransferase